MSCLILNGVSFSPDIDECSVGTYTCEEITIMDFTPQILTSVTWELITVTQTLPAVMTWGPFPANATMGLREMGSCAQVTLIPAVNLYESNVESTVSSLPDLNECRSGNFECPMNADCMNTEGSYACLCRDGYAGESCEGRHNRTVHQHFLYCPLQISMSVRLGQTTVTRMLLTEPMRRVHLTAPAEMATVEMAPAVKVGSCVFQASDSF